METIENFDLDLEDSDDEAVERVSESTIDPRLYRKLATLPSKLVSLAFTVPDDVPALQLNGSCLVWSREAMAAFAAIYKAARDVDAEYMKNFPFAFLRGAIEVQLSSAIRLRPDMGLSRGELESFSRSSTREPQPFAYLEATSEQEVTRTLKPLFNDWIINNLIPKYADPGKVEQRLIDRVTELARNGGLAKSQPFTSKAMPWPWESKTGTTRSADPLAFQALADLAAKTLAGQELFQGLGPMRRLISASGRPNCAELVTTPKAIGDHGRLSLVVRLSVETMPSLHQPLLVMNVSKRRWLDSLDDEAFDRSQITGTVFSDVHRDRAFRFSLQRRRRSQGHGWTVDNAYDAIRRSLGLPLQVNDAADLLRGAGDTQTAKVYLNYRPSISEDRHSIQAGVPERDKLEAFTEAAEFLREIGFQPFTAATRVKISHNKSHEAAARMIEAPTLLGALLEMAAQSPNDETRFTPGYLQSFPVERVSAMLQDQFQINVSQIAMANQLLGASRKGKAVDHAAALEQIIEANRLALRRLYGEPPALVLFHEDGPEAERDVLLLRAGIRLLWGDLEIVCNRLPSGTHGPESVLEPPMPNGKRASAAERSQRRVEAWKGVADQMRRTGKRHLCLIMARAYYQDATGTTGGKRDDRVNKPSTRRALAGAGAAVQFLLPPQPTKNGTKLADFLLRMQAAMKDLLWAHRGRIDTVPDAVQACFPDPDTRPREVIGITIVRRESGRTNLIGSSFLPIAIRLDVASGRCDLRCAYESPSGGGYTSSRWEQLSDALAHIARLSPIKLAEDPRERKSRFMRFVEEIIGESVDDGAQPVILVDSSNVVQLWPWLADSRISVDDVSVGERQWMQDNWAGARIIRIRHGLAPSLVDDKKEALAETWVEDARPLDEVDPDRFIMVTTAPGGGLFKIGKGTSAGCVAYLSVGRKTLHQQKRGVSCYRQTQLLGKPKIKVDGRLVAAPVVKNAAGCDTRRLVQYEPHIGQWPSPQPLEIVVTIRQPNDDPNRLAEFVERLRYGFGHYREWTTLPAPLFFERVVRDYVSQFDIEEAQSADTEGTAAED